MKTLPIITIAMLLATPCVFADGTEIYNKKCASCHGKDGKGDTKMGKKKGARDYTDPAVQASFSDEEGVKAILDGLKDDKGKVVMKGASGKISEADAKAMIQYMRTFAK